MDGINIKNLSLEFLVGDKTKKVIEDLSLNLELNKITVVVGKSGCGKTTLLRAISGIEKPSSGVVELNNFKIGYVFQEPRLMPWLNVYENIIFGLKDNVVESEIDNLLELIGLRDYKMAYPNQLSGGMKSRVSIARAMAYNPDYLLMDEPFASLDYFTRMSMQDELIRLYNKNNLAILFVTHNIEEAIALGDRILIMKDGKISKEFNLKKEERNLLSEDVILLKKEILEGIKDKWKKYCWF